MTDKNNKTPSVLKPLLHYVRPHMWLLFVSLIFAVISVAATLYAPILVGDAVDLIVSKDNVDFAGVRNVLIKLGVTVGITAAAQWLMSLCTNKVTYYAVRDLRNDAFSNLQRLPLSYIDGTKQGDMISRLVSDIENVSDGLLMGFAQLFTGLVTIFGTLGFMLSINVRITLVVVFITPLSLFVAGFIGKLTSRRFREQQILQGEISSYVEEYVGNQRIVKAFAYEEQAFEDFDRYNTELYDVGFKAQYAGALANPTTRLVNAIVYAAVGIIGALAALSGTLTVGGLSCFLTYANQYTKPFNEVTGVLTQLQTGIAAAGRVFEVLEAEDETPESDSAPSPGHKGEVSIEDVSFSYTPEKPLMKHFSLNVKSGTHVAIVGPTGCGKTTLINLLMRFYDVNSGRILVDGTDIREMRRDDLRSRYGMVLQDSWLFHGTIMENLRYGSQNASDEEIVAAAKAAYAHSFIRRMPNGYNTVISEGGGNLSQGQKQLLCIARAMLTNPEILILDEATSSIDTLTEIRVQKAFTKMMKGRTSFVVAHRLSTIKESDVILVMRDGNIVEQGSHNELLKKKGFYHELYSSQFSKSR